MLEELYQESILELARSKKHRGSLETKGGSLDVLLNNPLCGDCVHLWVDCQGCKVNDVKYMGQGCSISQAAAALMAETVQGQGLEKVRQVVEDFRQLISGRADDQVRERLGELTILEGVKRFPSRTRCALLAFEALGKLVTELEKKGCTPDEVATALGSASAVGSSCHCHGSPPEPASSQPATCPSCTPEPK